MKAPIEIINNSSLNYVKYLPEVGNPVLNEAAALILKERALRKNWEDYLAEKDAFEKSLKTGLYDSWTPQEVQTAKFESENN